MKGFIEVPQNGETVLISVSHIAAIKTKNFGDSEKCEIYVSTPFQKKKSRIEETGCLIIQSNLSLAHLRHLIEEAL